MQSWYGFRILCTAGVMLQDHKLFCVRLYDMHESHAFKMQVALFVVLLHTSNRVCVSQGAASLRTQQAEQRVIELQHQLVRETCTGNHGRRWCVGVITFAHNLRMYIYMYVFCILQLTYLSRRPLL